MMGEAVHESEVSHVIVVPQILPPARWPSLSGCFRTAGLSEKQVPGQHKRTSAPQELGTASGLAPGRLGLGSCFHGT